MKLKWGDELELPYITILLLSQVFPLVLCMARICICMEIQTWRWGVHAQAHMEICKHASTHSINPSAVHGAPTKRAHCLFIIYTARIIVLPISLQWIRDSILKCRKRSNRNTHRLSLHQAWNPTLWLWWENGGASEWLRLHYPVRAVVLVCFHTLSGDTVHFWGRTKTRPLEWNPSNVLKLLMYKEHPPRTRASSSSYSFSSSCSSLLPHRGDLTACANERQREKKRLNCAARVWCI